ncbi:Potassium transporter, putative [Ricinus communis]|uniref:Potassium transporter n=1 Tax=Ricinus communis TaxID=3988 RepID=B9SQ92_RICCO|nr:Potassium transporter, putative [Ricinus communis]|eukprot:XP_002528161.1 potassium transporter 5 [Ricinus communis]
MVGINEETQRAAQQEEQSGDHQRSGHVKNLVKIDLFDLEVASGGGTNTRKVADWATILKLAFQCIGVVYGDLGTSPLYVIPGVFPDGIKEKDDLIGVLSLIIYSIIFISFIKYVIVVLAANDNGDGGTFALYSLICRHAKVNLIPNQQVEDKELSNYKLEVPDRRAKMASAIKSLLEKSCVMKYFMSFLSMLGVSMVLGDGILTPCMSVLSAVGGIKEANSSLNDDTIMWISVVILILLFQVQRFGTDKIGYSFAPILLVWFIFIACIGVFNFFKYDPGVIKAINPWYIVQYLQRNRNDIWVTLGGVVLCLTGSEALFADLGHFNIRSIQLSTCVVVIPSILLCYIGQVSYLREHTGDAYNAFYSSIPKPVYWPQFVLAVLASIIASQSLISAAFSIIQQAVALGSFPRIKVVHTSSKYEGQVYVPEINTFLMIACVGVTLGFKTTLHMGNAYGLAATGVFVITSAFMILIMIMIWKTHIILIIAYVLTIGVFECSFLIATLGKFIDGGYLPLLLACLVVSIMTTWSYGHRKKYMYELENKVAAHRIADIVADERIHRVKGLGLFYTHLVQGISPVFTHYISSVPALHTVLVFVSIKSVTISKVAAEERFLFQRVKPEEMIFRCIVRYGYRDSRKEQEDFEGMLADQLKEFIKEEEGEDVERELAVVDQAVRDGVVYLMGEAEVMASNGSSCVKKLVVDYLYNWLSRSVRPPDEVLLIPRKRLLKVGMNYEV